MIGKRTLREMKKDYAKPTMGMLIPPVKILLGVEKNSLFRTKGIS